MSFLALPPSNSDSFLPLATTMRFASRISLRASLSPSLRLAGTVSAISMLRASRNLDALVQLVQPLRW